MLNVYKDLSGGLWIETFPGTVRYIGTEPGELVFFTKVGIQTAMNVGPEWSFEEANATYELQELML